MAPCAVRSIAAALCILLVLPLNFHFGVCQGNNETGRYTTDRIMNCDDPPKDAIYFENAFPHHYKSGLGNDLDIVITRTMDDPINIESVMMECNPISLRDCITFSVWMYELCSALEEGRKPENILEKFDDIVAMLHSVNVTCPIQEGTYKVQRMPNFFYDQGQTILEDTATLRLKTTMLNGSGEEIHCSQRDLQYEVLQ